MRIYTHSCAAKGGHLDCLKYLHKNDCPWNEYTCNDAARRVISTVSDTLMRMVVLGMNILVTMLLEEVISTVSSTFMRMVVLGMKRLILLLFKEGTYIASSTFRTIIVLAEEDYVRMNYTVI